MFENAPYLSSILKAIKSSLDISAYFSDTTRPISTTHTEELTRVNTSVTSLSDGMAVVVEEGGTSNNNNEGETSSVQCECQDSDNNSVHGSNSGSSSSSGLSDSSSEGDTEQTPDKDNKHNKNNSNNNTMDIEETP